MIVDTDTLSITYREGDTDTAVVTFSGVGLQVDRIPQEEFVKTQSGTLHSQYFVIDKARSWYNATAADIVSHLTPLLARHRKVVTLGNSMGGFGAIYFASRLPNCRAAISFVPQFSVDPAIVPNETRWSKYRSKITTWTVRHAMEQANANTELSLFFGSEESRDLEHLELFQKCATPRTSIFSLRDARHGAAQYLKRNGDLRPLLDLVIVEEKGAKGIERFLSRREVPHTFWVAPAASQQ